MTRESAEHHLMILWEHARPKQQRIIDDVRRRMQILAAFEVQWSKHRVSENFSRFYGQNLPPGSFKEDHCGRGPFLALILRDPHPRYEMRETSKGKRIVNVNTFDAKQCYRQWTGGGHRIHATDSEAEARHDIALLFGMAMSELIERLPKQWNGRIAQMSVDLVGAAGWKDLTQLLHVLNETIPYVVLRNFEHFPDAYTSEAHGDIDLLTTSDVEMAYVMNAHRVFPQAHRVHYATYIAGQEVRFDFRYIGDGYYDARWQREMLERRVRHEGGFFTPAASDHFYALLYHALVHKPKISDEYAHKLAALTAQPDALAGPDTHPLTPTELQDPQRAKQLLDQYLQQHGYRYTRPADTSVYFNSKALERDAPDTDTCALKESDESAPSALSTEARVLSALQSTNDRSLASEDIARMCLDASIDHCLGSACANTLRPLERLLRGRKVLEIGARFGTRSRFMGEIGAQVTAYETHPLMMQAAEIRCADLPNVSVTSDLTRASTGPTCNDYDVVLIADPGAATQLSAAIQTAQRHLRPGGCLILMSDNRLGLRYWAGAAQAGSAWDFAGIQGLTQDGRLTAPGRRELIRALNQHGLVHQKFYYPFPDHRKAFLVLSENARSAPAELLYNLLSACHTVGHNAGRDPLFSEGCAFRSLIENDLLGDMANAFVVIASTSPLPPVDQEDIAYTYSGLRRSHLAKEVAIHRVEGALRVRRRLLNPTSATPWMRFEADEPLLPGELLFNRLLPVMNQPGWHTELIAQWMRPLYEHLASKTHHINGQSYLDGQYLDATPFNFIGHGSEYQLFDLEWCYWPKVRLEYVLLRGIYYSLRKLGSVAEPRVGTPLEIIHLAEEVIRLLTGEPCDARPLLAQEIELQAAVTGIKFSINGFYQTLPVRSHAKLPGGSCEQKGTAHQPLNQPPLRLPDQQSSAELGESDKNQHRPQTRPATLEQWLAARTLSPSQEAEISRRLAATSGTPPLAVFITAQAGAREALVATLHSLEQACRLGAKVEIHVVLDASIDATDLPGTPVVHFHAPGAEIHALNDAIRHSGCAWALRVQAGDLFTPNGLSILALELCEAKDCRAVYADLLYRSADGSLGAAFRPDFNLDLFLSFPAAMASHWCFHRAHFEALGGLDPDAGPAAEFDLLLRLIEKDGLTGLGHVHEPLLIGSPPLPIDVPQERAALLRHLRSRGYEFAQVHQDHPRLYRIEYGHASQPLVSIIIPTRDQLALLRRCVESLLEKTRYQNYELLIVDNQSATEEARQWLEGVASFGEDRIRVLRYDHPFNFSAMNNLAVEHARGEYLVLLNNDTAIIDPHWLDALLNHAQRPEVGAVGAKLLYPDGTIQHAGVVLGLRGPAEHPFAGEALDSPGTMQRLRVDQNYSAVTAACLMIRKSVYQEVGGMDEVDFKVSYNDVDLCLKVASAGYLNVWTPHALVMHEGSVSQKQLDPQAAEARRQRFVAEQDALYAKWMPIIANDPAYNRNLSLNDKGFSFESRVDLVWHPLSWRPAPIVLAHMADHWGCGHYRVIQPHEAMRRSGHIEGLLSDTMLLPAELARLDPDAIVLQRQLTEQQLESMRRMKAFSRAFKVYELDDYLPNLPIKSAYRKNIPKDAVKSLRQALGYVDRFVVSTDALAEAFEGLHPDIRVVKNKLPTAWWSDMKPRRRRGKKPRVGWAGGAGHAGDLALLIDVVKALAGEVEWVFFGLCPAEIVDVVDEVYKGVPIDQYPAMLAGLDLDLALAPLEHNQFNECKSNLRLLEYGICGYPVVCSDIRCYRDDELPVTRVKNRFKDWVEAIRMHTHDLDAAARAGDALREAVRSQWMLEGAALEEWKAAWTQP
ncbi:glycosyltransferase [Caldimonas manganoxidans]|uniref:glycosyltransferase n=1 Tax=Caldimonas manganoxidans TaxID=196015 RepID=UPI000361DF70|nr:glycosyltransferase [Caldimonas manganoxidans]